MDIGYRLPPSHLGSARASTALTLGSASVLDTMRNHCIDTAAEVATKVARAGGTSAIEASFITFGLHSPLDATNENENQNEKGSQCLCGCWLPFLLVPLRMEWT